MHSEPVPAPSGPLRAAALDYAERDWSVFPAPPGTKKGYKKSADCNGRRWGCTTNPAEIAADWARWPDANVAIACGAASGFFVIEADTLEGHGVDGVSNFEDLIAQHGELPATIEARSPSGSRHFYFAWPQGLEVRNSDGRIAPGVDVRGEGGMVMAPPSVKPGHPLPYRWIRPPDEFELAQCPEWLLRLCGSPRAGGVEMMASADRTLSAESDERVIRLLYTRPNELPRQEWVRLCLSLKAHLGERARDGWLSFSQRYCGKVTPGEAERQWECAKPDGRLTLGTAVHLLGGFEGGRAANPTAPLGSAGPLCAGDHARANRPSIRVRAGELHLMATEAEEALVAANAPLFVRGGLVRPIVDDLPASYGRRTKVARLAPVDADTIADHLSRCADWVKFNVRLKAEVPTDPPPAVCRTILARDGEWHFRKLTGVLTTPTVRPDGTILSSPGYDRATQLLLLDPPTLPRFPQAPSRDDAIAALGLLNSLFDEFPFVDGASRSVALSAILSCVARGAMQTVPLHAMTAPVAGSGKSFIVDIVSAIATGERAPVISAGQNEEETEKRLGAALLSGQPIVSIDNVNGRLGGDQLCQMIERPLVSVRPLGLSKLVRIENRATCFATGNNIQLLGDMTRRGVLCSLDPNVERPELRTFRASPLDLVLADRGKFVAAALTIVRAYVIAGFPKVLSPLASFEEWSRIVRSALVWLDQPDPCETMEKARGEDPVIASLSGVLTAWHTTVGSSSHTTGEMKEKAELRDPYNLANVELHRALAEVADDKRGGINSRSLGHYLARHKGRIVDGLKLLATEDKGAKQALWRVVRHF